MLSSQQQWPSASPRGIILSISKNMHDRRICSLTAPCLNTRALAILRTALQLSRAARAFNPTDSAGPPGPSSFSAALREMHQGCQAHGIICDCLGSFLAWRVFPWARTRSRRTREKFEKWEGTLRAQAYLGGGALVEAKEHHGKMQRPSNHRRGVVIL